MDELLLDYIYGEFPEEDPEKETLISFGISYLVKQFLKRHLQEKIIVYLQTIYEPLVSGKRNTKNFATALQQKKSSKKKSGDLDPTNVVQTDYVGIAIMHWFRHFISTLVLQFPHDDLLCILHQTLIYEQELRILTWNSYHENKVNVEEIVPETSFEGELDIKFLDLYNIFDFYVPSSPYPGTKAQCKGCFNYHKSKVDVMLDLYIPHFEYFDKKENLEYQILEDEENKIFPTLKDKNRRLRAELMQRIRTSYLSTIKTHCENGIYTEKSSDIPNPQYKKIESNVFIEKHDEMNIDLKTEESPLEGKYIRVGRFSSGVHTLNFNPNTNRNVLEHIYQITPGYNNIRPKLKVEWTGNKIRGHGLFCEEESGILPGDFIIQYVGKVSSTYSPKSGYVLSLDDLDRPLYIDAEEMGNESRFSNHSSKYFNCDIVTWIINGKRTQWLVNVTCEIIPYGAEILWNYGSEVSKYPFVVDTIPFNIRATFPDNVEYCETNKKIVKKQTILKSIQNEHTARLISKIPTYWNLPGKPEEIKDKILTLEFNPEKSFHYDYADENIKYIFEGSSDVGSRMNSENPHLTCYILKENRKLNIYGMVFPCAIPKERALMPEVLDIDIWCRMKQAPRMSMRRFDRIYDNTQVNTNETRYGWDDPNLLRFLDPYERYTQKAMSDLTYYHNEYILQRYLSLYRVRINELPLHENLDREKLFSIFSWNNDDFDRYRYHLSAEYELFDGNVNGRYSFKKTIRTSILNAVDIVISDPPNSDDNVMIYPASNRQKGLALYAKKKIQPGQCICSFAGTVYKSTSFQEIRNEIVGEVLLQEAWRLHERDPKDYPEEPEDSARAGFVLDPTFYDAHFFIITTTATDRGLSQESLTYTPSTRKKASLDEEGKKNVRRRRRKGSPHEQEKKKVDHVYQINPTETGCYGMFVNSSVLYQNIEMFTALVKRKIPKPETNKKAYGFFSSSSSSSGTNADEYYWSLEYWAVNISGKPIEEGEELLWNYKQDSTDYRGLPPQSLRKKASELFDFAFPALNNPLVQPFTPPDEDNRNSIFPGGLRLGTRSFIYRNLPTTVYDTDYNNLHSYKKKDFKLLSHEKELSYMSSLIGSHFDYGFRAILDFNGFTYIDKTKHKAITGAGTSYYNRWRTSLNYFLCCLRSNYISRNDYDVDVGKIKDRHIKDPFFVEIFTLVAFYLKDKSRKLNITASKTLDKIKQDIYSNLLGRNVLLSKIDSVHDIRSSKGMYNTNVYMLYYGMLPEKNSFLQNYPYMFIPNYNQKIKYDDIIKEFQSTYFDNLDVKKYYTNLLVQFLEVWTKKEFLYKIKDANWIKDIETLPFDNIFDYMYILECLSKVISIDTSHWRNLGVIQTGNLFKKELDIYETTNPLYEKMIVPSHHHEIKVPKNEEYKLMIMEKYKNSAKVVNLLKWIFSTDLILSSVSPGSGMDLKIYNLDDVISKLLKIDIRNASKLEDSMIEVVRMTGPILFQPKNCPYYTKYLIGLIYKVIESTKLFIQKNGIKAANFIQSKKANSKFPTFSDFSLLMENIMTELDLFIRQQLETEENYELASEISTSDEEEEESEEEEEEGTTRTTSEKPKKMDSKTAFSLPNKDIYGLNHHYGFGGKEWILQTCLHFYTFVQIAWKNLNDLPKLSSRDKRINIRINKWKSLLDYRLDISDYNTLVEFNLATNDRISDFDLFNNIFEPISVLDKEGNITGQEEVLFNKTEIKNYITKYTGMRKKK